MTSLLSKGYDNEGAYLKLEVRLPFSSLKTFEFPRCCSSCPVGYMDHHCGRNVPFKDEDYEKRPDTCKLELVTIQDYLNDIRREQEVR